MNLNIFNFRAYNIVIPSVLRKINTDDMTGLVTDKAPAAGDIVLARIKTLGHKNYLIQSQGKTYQDYNTDHKIEVPLQEGHYVLLSYGDRYAVDEYKSIVPPSLAECQLVTAGGIASQILATNESMDAPTIIEPLGLVSRANGDVINIKDYALPYAYATPSKKPPCLLVVGTGMNAGKSTAAAALTKGLSDGGYRVGYAKITGTGNDGDPLKQKRAGAYKIYDFVDCGRSTTFRQSLETTERDFTALTSYLAQDGCDVTILELADGIMMQENIDILRSNLIKDGVDAVLFAAADQAGAILGLQRLKAMDYNIVAVSGKMTMAPVAIEEYQLDEESINYNVPCISRENLTDPQIAKRLFETVKEMKKIHPEHQSSYKIEPAI